MLVANAVDLPHLAGAEALIRIEAPESLHQTLSPQNFVATGNAAMKVVGDIEERAVAIGDAGIKRQQIRRHGVLVTRGAAHLELFYRARGPYRPVAKQAATKIGPDRHAIVAQVERQHE